MKLDKATTWFYKGKVDSLLHSILNLRVALSVDKRSKLFKGLEQAYEGIDKANEALLDEIIKSQKEEKKK